MTPDELRGKVDDLQALALTMMFEAGGDALDGSSVEERIAVASVIRNRVMHPRRFQSTYRAACVARSQFSCWWPYGGPGFARLMVAAAALVNGEPLLFSVPERSVFTESYFLAEGIIGGQVLDRVRGATHYYAPAAMIPKGSAPGWAKGLTPTAKVGRQLFFVAS